ncbi:M3 family oligoendopeptidase [Oceanithermus sp.]|uniref:M3 family oligoendopeptidase n=1 Tax=Oceanithermus sp. TaxID=2268145 RepID=UPI002600A8E5|nr:M3 family oligoendopeptidase [Oceanithermus sp.]
MPQETLPRWDLTPLFAEIETPEFREAWARLEGAIEAFEALVERLGVGGPDAPHTAAALEQVAAAYDAADEALTPLKAYLQLRIATDAEDRPAAAKLSELEGLTLRLDRLRPRLVRWWGGFPADFEAGPYRRLLAEARVRAAHQMSEPEETLAAELTRSGARAWTRLHGNVTSRIRVDFEGEELPITALRNLAYDADPVRREAAYRKELEAWREHQDVIAASLNGVKGERAVLVRRRGWADALEPTLLERRITRAALEAMQRAVEASFPDWRRYFRAKARFLGKERLDWWDLFAPVGRSQKRWSWSEARDFIVRHLQGFSPAAAELADRAFRERWIDAEPRVGKRGGAFCMHVGGGASRILANYSPTFDAVSTLAHELGHAYHNLRLAERPALLRTTPMTLAETASIMNETVVTQAALVELEGDEALAVLETWLQGAAQVVVDIHSRFLFESWVFERRAARELGPEEFAQLMEEAQRRTYGDALASYHPYMWAVKPHYYGSDFYNYPYTFGLLFGLGLYRAYRDDPEGFAGSYDALLADTGLEDAAALAGRFGFDLEDEAFWAGGLELLAEQIARFEALAP